MRTLTLLTALLLLAIQAQAQILQETADQVPTKDETGDEDQDVAISFTGEERLTQEAAGHQGIKTCTCQTGDFCLTNETHSGSCKLDDTESLLCCQSFVD